MNTIRPMMSKFASVLQSYWLTHLSLALIWLISTIPMLWPDWFPMWLQESAGYVFLAAFGLSLLLELILVLRELLHLQNQVALLRILSFIFIWSAIAAASLLLTYSAKVPMDQELVQAAPELDITVHEGEEELMGDSSLVIHVQLRDESADKIIECANLVSLESEHSDIFKRFLQHSPRWNEHASATFYAQLGHVEFIVKDKDGNPRGTVHAAFRAISEGEEMPQDYAATKPNSPLPESKSGKSELGIPDLALDLGGDYFLLLAWRGLDDRDLALRCINEVLHYIDASVDSLAKNPSLDQIERITQGVKKFRKKQPELLLCEPPSQYGTYQAEIYANPREAGQILLLIKDSKTRQVLRLISCYAQYSDNEHEYFLHEIPSDLPNWLGRQDWAPGKLMLQQGIPLFTIKRGESDATFDADFEVWFAPNDSHKSKYRILTKRYRVHACDYLSDTKLQADEESDRTITQEDVAETLKMSDEATSTAETPSESPTESPAKPSTSAPAEPSPRPSAAPTLPTSPPLP